MLTDFNRPRGSNPSQLSSGSEIDDAIKYVTPEMFKDKVINGDWAPAIQAAADYASEKSLTGVCLGVLYPIKQGINVPKNIDIYGLGKNSGVVVESPQDNQIICFYVNDTDITLRDFSILFNNEGKGSISKYAIFGVFTDGSSSNCLVDNLKIKGCYNNSGMGFSTGARITGKSNKITRCQIEYCSMGITARGDDITIDGNYCSNYFVTQFMTTWSYANPCWDGITCEGLTNSKIINNTCIYNGQSGIYMGGNSSLSYGNIISQNIVKNNFNRGIDVGISGTKTITNWVNRISIIGNQVINNREPNIWVYGTDNVIINSNLSVIDGDYYNVFRGYLSTNRVGLNVTGGVGTIIDGNKIEVDNSSPYTYVLGGTQGTKIGQNILVGPAPYILNGAANRILREISIPYYSGTWTPTIVSGSGITLNSSSGTFTIEDNKLTVDFTVRISQVSGSSPSGSLVLGYLPGIGSSTNFINTSVNVYTYSSFQSTLGNSVVMGYLDGASKGRVVLTRVLNGTWNFDLASFIGTDTTIKISATLQIEKSNKISQISLHGHSFLSSKPFADALGTNQSKFVYNFARGGSSSQEAAIVAGAKPLVVTVENNTIPASGAVKATLSDTSLGLLWAGATFSGTLAGVEGVFTAVNVNSSDYTQGTYLSFLRSKNGTSVTTSGAGETVTVLPLTRSLTTTVSSPTLRYDRNDDIVIIWAGRNTNGGSITQIMADIALIVAKLTTNKFVICPEFPYSTETTGTAAATNIANLNSTLASTYPNNYCAINGVDLLQNFKNKYNPAYAQDVTDIANGITPSSLRKDNIHPSESLQANALYIGVNVNADFISSFISSKGWS